MPSSQPPGPATTSSPERAPACPAGEGGTGALCPEANPSPVDPAQRSVLDRIVRQALLIEHASPRAMFELRGSLVLSAVRCILTYAVIPVLAPVIGWAGVLATPLSLVLSLTAIVLAITSLRRVWMADYRYRWPYTGFILVAVGLLAVVVVLDTRTLLS
jgi:hypothetical protein